ncbi:hypothetical protein HF086_007525 [Spodoptera exigua]|uniref:Uncharacterized protein n=1 Tax=Spodoptera exigua TaxID=7107 RepID=A0A922M397_SPOEX|nr:hypothetical protein HF086_007525 [Spodoptera exigua]
MLTGTDVVNAIVLLSGIIMLPTNVHILCSIANGRRIDYKSKVVCCPLWLCVVWIVIINLLGAACCLQKIYSGKYPTLEKIDKTIRHYRSVPKYKHFVDNLQWSLKCCGLNSYKDWFNHDWYDKIRDYEWDPSANKRNGLKKRDLETLTDSLLVLRYIIKNCPCPKDKRSMNMNVRHIMSVNDRFASSNSLQMNPDDTDYENEVHLGDVRMDGSGMTIVNRAVEDEDSESAKDTKKWRYEDD